uniref:Uncharacterized protein n=1 Tax=Rangifer tarandus platyrhynchus TaxID=3082113 RepID=A0ACB0EXS1_RANTA|nr:unnamed protein product [Rangifer tarandus platyrhynchus]
MDQQMNQQSPAHPWNPALDYDVETAVQRALNRTGGGWPLHVQVVLPLRALVAMAALGNDSLSLGSTALVLVEEIFKLGAQLTLQAATILHPVSHCCDTGGLCLLAALGVLAPAWSRRRRPRGTSAVPDPGIPGPQRCSSARTYLVICTVAVAVLRWGLPLAIVTFLPRQEYLSMSFDLLLLLSSAVCTAHWVIYLLAGRLRRGRHQDTRDVLRQRAPMRALEVTFCADASTGPRPPRDSPGSGWRQSRHDKRPRTSGLGGRCFLSPPCLGPQLIRP